MNDIMEKKENVLAILGDNGLKEMIQPLVQEIHLFDTFIAGTSYIKNKDIFNTLTNNQLCILMRENNKFDEKAIVVLTEEKVKLGYIPEKDNLIFSRLMDAGKRLIARISSVELKHSYVKVQIKVYLVDF